MTIGQFSNFQIFIICKCASTVPHSDTIHLPVVAVSKELFITILTFTFLCNKSDFIWSSVWPHFNTYCMLKMCLGKMIIQHTVHLFTLIYAWFLINARTSSHNTAVKRKRHHHRGKSVRRALQDSLWPTLSQNTTFDKICPDISFCSGVTWLEFCSISFQLK